VSGTEIKEFTAVNMGREGTRHEINILFGNGTYDNTRSMRFYNTYLQQASGASGYFPAGMEYELFTMA
jgi:hypothetical protein